jgi:hypothetical protein
MTPKYLGRKLARLMVPVIATAMANAMAIGMFGALGSCEEDFPDSPPPGSCVAGEKVCYHEPNSGRELLLRCNDGEVEGAIWLIAEVCLDGAICQVDRCAAPGGSL